MSINKLGGEVEFGNKVKIEITDFKNYCIKNIFKEAVNKFELILKNILKIYF
jgi:hypothetical protein